MRKTTSRPESGLVSFKDASQLNTFATQSAFIPAKSVDLRYYWAVIFQYRWQILSLAMIVTLLTTLIVFAMTPVYRSEASLLVEGKQNKLLSIEEVYSMDTSRTEYFQTQFEILKSPDLARSVIKSLNLMGYPEFKKFKPEPETKSSWQDILPAVSEQPLNAEDEAEKAKLIAEEKLLKVFLDRLTVKPRLKTQLVDISFDANDPKLAQAIVNKLGNAFIDSGMESRMESTHKAAEWLSSRLDSLKGKLTGSEDHLQDFLTKEKLVDLEGVLTLAGKEIDQNSLRLTAARQTRLELESIYNKIKQGTDADLISEVLQDKSVQYLKEQKAVLTSKVSDLNQRYGPDHPAMAAARSELKGINDLLNKEIRIIVGGIKSRYEVAKTNEQAIIDSIATNKQQVQDISRKQTQYRELQREVNSNRSLYETFFNRFKEANEASEISSATARFIDKANLPILPVKPKKSLIIVLTFVGMLLLGTLLAFLLDFLNSTLKSPDDVETKLDLPFLGVIPLMPKIEEDKIGKLVIDEPRGVFAEAIRTIRTGLILSTLDSPRRVWMITSSFQSEGKSTLSMNLAQAMAQLEGGNDNRVLLIDADLRRPTLHKRFKLPPRSKGLSHVLAFNEALDNCVYPIEGLNLDVMPAGIPPPNPLELLASTAFANLLEKLEERYSVVLIDSPPVHAVSDAQWLAQHVRSVIYVAKANTTSIQAIRKGINILDSSGTPLAGIVLTQLDIEKSRRFDSGGYSNYYYYQSAYGTDQDD
jgi:capsular exopolysaccharide synthesis family protein